MRHRKSSRESSYVHCPRRHFLSNQTQFLKDLSRCLQILLVAAICFVSFQPLAISAQAADIGILLDCSPSMRQDDRLNYAKEAAKLLIAIPDDDVQLEVAAFSLTARHQRFTPGSDRTAAMRWLDGLSILRENGTDYLAGLSQQPRRGQRLVLISDGEHQASSPESVLRYVEANLLSKGVVVDTLGIACPRGSAQEDLMSRISATTGGVFVRIEESEELTTALIEIARHLGKYRRMTPKDDELQFTASGRVLAIGYDCDLLLKSNETRSTHGPVHNAKLPGELVQVRSLSLKKPSHVAIRIRNRHSANGRIAGVFRADLPSTSLQVKTEDGRGRTGETVTAVISSELDGKTFDPRGRISSQVRVIDADGNLVGEYPAIRSKDDPVLEAKVELPGKAGPVQIEALSSIRDSGQTWTDSARATLIAEASKRIVATPAGLRKTVKAGQLTESISLRLDDKSMPGGQWSARLTESPSAIELISAVPHGQTIKLRLAARVPGRIRATLRITNADSTVVPLDFPIDLNVKPSVTGLAGDRIRTIDLGTFTATHGEVQSRLEFQGRDTKVDYRVETTDLSHAGTILPTNVPDMLTARSTARSGIPIAVTIGDVPAGEYHGMIKLSTRKLPDVDWIVRLRVTVTDPIDGRVVMDRDLPAGGFASGQLILVNRGNNAVTGLEIKPSKTFGIDGKKVTGIEMRADAAPIPELGPGKKTTVKLDFAAKQGVPHGKAVGHLRVLRRSGSARKIPVTVTIADKRKQTLFRAIPSKVTVTGKRGQLVKFQIRLRPSPELMLAETIDFSTGRFRSDSRDPNVVVHHSPESPVTLRPKTPSDFSCAVLLPRTRGVFEGEITLRGSSIAGRTVVPVLLQVD